MLKPDLFLELPLLTCWQKSRFQRMGRRKVGCLATRKQRIQFYDWEKFLIWHLFGTKGKKKVNMDMVDEHIKEITANQNAHNSHNMSSIYELVQMSWPKQDKNKMSSFNHDQRFFSPYKEDAHYFKSSYPSVNHQLRNVQNQLIFRRPWKMWRNFASYARIGASTIEDTNSIKRRARPSHRFYVWRLKKRISRYYPDANLPAYNLNNQQSFLTQM